MWHVYGHKTALHCTALRRLEESKHESHSAKATHKVKDPHTTKGPQSTKSPHSIEGPLSARRLHNLLEDRARGARPGV